MKIAFFTLGCKVNQYESQEMICRLKSKGYMVVDTKEEADIYVVNSCTVTAESSRKTRQSLRKFRNEHPDAVIVLTGCYTQAFSEETSAFEEADIILGNKTNCLLEEKLEEFFAEKQRCIQIEAHKKDDGYNGGIITDFEGHTRAFVKIQDGCNRYCTYCIIPKARGFSRSKPIDDIKKEVALLAKEGYKEIVFVGINLSSYGMDIGLNICDALQTAQDTKGIERIRLGSLEPDHITDKVIERLATMDKFCPQFHLSLQSGCDKTLKRMNRHYTKAEYLTLCSKLKATFPDISLTTDIIAGFPGETEEDFNESVEFAKQVDFMKVHIFPFSAREGTPAAKYPDKVSHAEKTQRCAFLQKECDRIRDEFLSRYIGKTVDVLFETPKGNTQSGYTANYIHTSVSSATPLIGQIKKVKITSADGDTCFGELI